jgi:tetratricopeptide (TPR) repeat protein
MRLLILPTTIIFTLLTSPLLAQDLKQSALDHFNNQQWEAASNDYLEYLKKNDIDSSAWYNLGYSQMQLKSYLQAIKYYTEAKKRNYNFNVVNFSISKAHALNGDVKSMFAALKEGVDNGMATYSTLQTDIAFVDYQSNPEFEAILEKVKLNAYPCLSSKERRHFDFWLGEWDVYVGDNKVGDNSITMAKGGCAIHENYTTARNYAGQSINYYDPIDKKWHQHWVGSGGDVYNYLETQREDGLLQFESKFMSTQGIITLSRLTFTLNDDGTVRQLFEGSSDDGKTWTPQFDGLYKRK